MTIPSWIENAFLRGTNAFFRHYPQPRPPAERLAQCRIISHRGEHDNRRIIENTLPAFRAAAAGGSWGIEFDVRWTRDRRPVVSHDPDARRLFGRAISIRQTDFSDLKRACPMIPTLDEVVRACGRKVHLMVELKDEPFDDIAHQRRVLEAHFAGLTPVTDFHMMSLAPEVLEVFAVVPPAARLPIAQAHVGAMSRLAADRHYGGLLGHCLLVTDRLVRHHAAMGQKVGTGFADSVNCLFREINRHVTWIFSNRAVALQEVINAALRPAPHVHKPGGAG
ncbi:MAG: glycerophosphodiester phosphodiesterase family protein [Desulfobacterales bacterium]